MNATLIVNAAAMTAVVTLLVSLLAPFVESVRGLQDTPANKPRHDAALRILNVVLNVALVFALVAATSGVTLADVLPLIVQALAQAAGAHFTFQAVTGAPHAPVAGSALADPAQPSDFPPGIRLEESGLPTTADEAVPVG